MYKNSRQMTACMFPCVHVARCDSVDIISNAELILLGWLSVLWAETPRDGRGFDICGFYSNRVVTAVGDVRRSLDISRTID